MKLFEYINKVELEKAISLGYIGIDTHPCYPNLKLVNYTKSCQDDKYWNDTTKKCRGLIYDENTEEIIAVPFKKFFNLEEYDGSCDEFKLSNIPINSNNIKILNKLDGSLGILYWVDDVPYITTKGSFSSDQGAHATKILHSKYSNVIDKLDRNVTYLFEIIYPEDLHCITYKGVDDIFLIGAIDTSNGNSLDIYKYSNLFNCTEDYPQYCNSNDWLSIREYISNEDRNREGFVIIFDDEFRLKLKYQEYWVLHYLKSGLSRRKILNAYCEGRSDEILKSLEILDEEHKIYYHKIISELIKVFNDIVDKCIDEYNYDYFENRKALVDYVKTCTYPSILFAMYDNKPYDYLCWKIVKRQIKNIDKEEDD